MRAIKINAMKSTSHCCWVSRLRSNSSKQGFNSTKRYTSSVAVCNAGLLKSVHMQLVCKLEDLQPGKYKACSNPYIDEMQHIAR